MLKPDQPVPNIFTLLTRNGANVNQIYPEKSFGDSYKCTVLINLIRQAGSTSDVKILMSNLQCLQHDGATFDRQDSLGRDAMIYAVIQNQFQIARYLINNIRNGLMINHQDNLGKSAIHFVVNPVSYGSFENIEILHLLYA